MTGISRKRQSLTKLKLTKSYNILYWTFSQSIIQIFAFFLGKFEAQRSYNLYFIKKCISIFLGIHIVTVIK